MKAGKMVFGLATAWMAFACAGATAIYVDKNRPDDSGDGLTPQTAFRTIQAGVDAVEAGGTVYVAPGSYDEGETVVAGVANRVFIDKPLTLEATDGKTVTEIVGKKDSDTVKTPGLLGVGPKAVRCIMVDSNTNVVTVKGFTIRDGATNSGSDTPANCGGGVTINATTQGPTAAYKTTLVDCTVRDCVGTRGGGVRRIRAVRTLFDNCTCCNSGTKNGGVARDGQFYWCVFRDCSQNVSALSDVTLVNCTVVGCEGAAVQKQASENCVYNTYFALLAGAVGDSGVHLYRSVASNAKTDIVCDDACKTDSDGYQLIAPALCDFRPIADGDLDGKGNRAYLENIPEEYRDKDFLGHAILATDDLSVGAVQTVAQKAGGRLDFVNFNSTNVTLTLEGCPIHVPGEYAYATAWPTQYEAKVSTVSGEELWGWHETTSDTMKFPELTNTRTLLMPPANTTDGFTYEPTLAGRVYYVAQTGDDEENDGLSDRSPLKTLQAAHDKVFQKWTGYTLVHVAEGAYDEGGYEYLNSNTRLVIRVPMRYIGAGPGKSIIRGAADPDGKDTHSGCGPNAWRCVLSRDVFSAVQGFTLADGHTSLNPSGTAYTQDQKVEGDGNGIRGGAYYAMSGKPCLIDCVVTNCSASRGAAIYGGHVVRCHIVDAELMANCAGNAIVRDCQLWGCTFFNVRGDGTQVLHTNGKYCHCSLVLGSTETTDYNDPSKVRVYNSACFGRPFVGKDTVYFGCVFDTDDVTQVGFLDPTVPDFRIRADAPAIGAGVATDDPDYALLCDWSMDGMRPLYMNGKPTAGAYQNPLRVFAYSDPYDETLTAKYYLGDGESAAVTPVPYAKRNPVGSVVDGVVREGLPIVLSGSDFPLPCAREIPISYVYSTNWYVNASAPDDTGDGFTPETAKKTLKGIMSADVRSGDVVHAAAGTYADESMVQTVKYSPISSDPDLKVKSRVVVPDGVSLVGDEGRDVTFIKGRWDMSPEAADKNGCGDNAIRCVCLGDSASLEGFTLCDGATLGADVGSDNNVGGGVIARRADLAGSPLIRNCTITNCSASRGGAGFGGRYMNCLILGNYAWKNGTLRECAACNCYFDGNRSAQVVGYSYGDIVNCTFTADNLAMVGTSLKPQAGVTAMQKGRVINCVFLAPAAHEMLAGYHNRFASGASYVVTTEGAEYDVDNVVAEAGQLEFTADGAPVIGSCIAVDKADATLYPADAGAFDCRGNQRVWNDALDIGAIEGDWRPVYAKDLKPSRCTVTEATPGVVETDAKAVQLADGEALTATLTAPRTEATPYVMRVSVTGGGTLTVVLNDGAETWTFDRPGELRFENALAENTLRCSYSGEGTADLLGIKSELGTVLFIR